MKKIKLIKEYPGSPKLGSIIDLVCNNYPEYWQEVVEKEYEILSLNIHDDRISVVTVYTDGYIEALLKDKLNKIHSVKRLSDGAVFTIGNTIYSNDCKPTKLEKITIRDNGSIAMWGKYYSNILGEIGLASCITKKPLYTTEKGENIFEDDEFYTARKDGIGFTHKHTADEEDLLDSTGLVFFLTREAADKYLYQNKPRFSFKDVVDAIEKSEDEILKPKWLFQRSVCDALEKYCLKENK